MWTLLGVESAIGMELTESMAMLPAAAVSAIVFANPCAQYFAVGKITAGPGGRLRGKEGGAVGPGPEVARAHAQVRPAPARSPSRPRITPVHIATYEHRMSACRRTLYPVHTTHETDTRLASRCSCLLTVSMHLRSYEP